MASFATLIIATAHPFPDGTGKAAIGVADVIIRRGLNKTLNLDTIEKKDNEFINITVPATHALYPDEYNPNVALVKSENLKNKVVINIPTQNGKETQEWINRFADNIIDKINNSDPFSKDGSNFIDFDTYKNKLAAFYKENSFNLN